MQTLYFHEIEVTYKRHRLQDAAVASSLAAQAISSGTTRPSPFMPNLTLACRRVGEVVQRLKSVLQSRPGGKELPVVQG